MKIEVGKYYKNKAGEMFGPMENNNDDVYPLICHAGGRYMSYMVDGTFYVNHRSEDDLVEEVNADGSPIVAESPASLSWNVPADRSWRDEIALRLLPTIYSEFQREARERGCPADWRAGICQDAFILADEFIKAAKQS